MWTWLLLMVGVPVLLGWAQSRLYRGFGADAPSSARAGDAQDDGPPWEDQTGDGFIGTAGEDPFAPLTDVHAATTGPYANAWASSEDTHAHRWSTEGMQHTSLGGDEDGALGHFGTQTAFCPPVNIDGTPMATCWIDVEGKPYGVTDMGSSLGSTMGHHDGGFTNAHDGGSATEITNTASVGGADWGDNATGWTTDDWSSAGGWHDSRW